MGYTSVTLKFGLGIEDEYKWTDEQRAAAEACKECGGDYCKHAEHIVAEAMLSAGESFLSRHAPMYRVLV